jgi:hypothetical protein
MEGTFKFSKCVVIVSKDAGRWHLSISRNDRLPNYDESSMRDMRICLRVLLWHNCSRRKKTL